MAMEYGQIPGVNKPVSRIVQGTIQVPVEDKNKEVPFAHFDMVYEMGINTFDTAFIYGNGKNDSVLGEWIRTRGLRDKVVVLAKGAHPGERKKVTEFDIAHDLHTTLARMKADYVDMYVLHRDDEAIPVREIVDALNKWTREGKIKAFGGSNWTHKRLQAANDYARASGQIPMAVSSPNFSMADQLKEPWGGCISIVGEQGAEARAWYAKENMPLFTWSSMAGGFLSGRFTRENKAEMATDYFNTLAIECYASEENFVRLDRAKELGDAKGLTIPQMAVAYITSYPLNIFPLIGSATKEEAAANVAALNTKLTPGEINYLDLKADSVV